MANGEEEREQRHTLPKRVSLEEDSCHANCTMVHMAPFQVAHLFGKVRPVRTRSSGGLLASCTTGRPKPCTRRSAEPWARSAKVRSQSRKAAQVSPRHPDCSFLTGALFPPPR